MNNSQAKLKPDFIELQHDLGDAISWLTQALEKVRKDPTLAEDLLRAALPKLSSVRSTIDSERKRVHDRK